MAIHATMEPPSTKGGRVGAKNPDEWVSIGLMGIPGGVPQIEIEERRRRIERGERTGSALVSMEIGIRAELGSAEMSMVALLSVLSRP